MRDFVFDFVTLSVCVPVSSLKVVAESLNVHILVISLCARHSKNLECSRPVQGLKQLALAHKSVCINWRLHSQGFCGVCLGLYHN